jgi:hypothetical protein
MNYHGASDINLSNLRQIIKEWLPYTIAGEVYTSSFPDISNNIQPNTFSSPQSYDRKLHRVSEFEFWFNGRLSTTAE